jgi:hypothetical protein
MEEVGVIKTSDKKWKSHKNFFVIFFFTQNGLKRKSRAKNEKDDLYDESFYAG